jgi:hypothetical protein
MAGGVVPSEKPVSKKLGPCNFALLFAAWEPICCLALSEIATASAARRSGSERVFIGSPSFDRFAIYDDKQSTGGTSDRQFPTGVRNSGCELAAEISMRELANPRMSALG